MTPTFDHSQLKNKTVIFCVLHYNYECVKITLKNIISIINKNPDTYMVLIDSKSEKKIKALFESVNHPRIDKISLPINFGYNTSVNYYIRDFINDKNLPKTIIRIDADILFSNQDFQKLCSAIENLPNFGVIGMSWAKNDCNPERNVPFKAKKYKGKNNTSYWIKKPILVPIAGGIMGLRGKILKELNYELFPPNKLPKRYLKVIPVGGADAALYNALKFKYKMGYLDGTIAYHLKNRDNTVLNIPEEYKHLLND